jgi:beta-mannosidase
MGLNNFCATKALFNFMFFKFHHITDKFKKTRNFFISKNTFLIQIKRNVVEAGNFIKRLLNKQMSSAEGTSISLKQWTLTTPDDNNSIGPLNAIVPGQVHDTLLHHHLIDSPFYGYRDSEYRWISAKTWVYSCSFINDNKEPSFLLILDGLDTFVKVILNGNVILNASNMFHRHLIPVSLEYHNVLVFEFPAIKEILEDLVRKYPYFVPDDFTPVSNGERYRNYVRKEQCSFSWDWGPCFLPCGPYRDVNLISLQSPYLSYVCPDISLSKQIWKVKIHVWMISNQNRHCIIKIYLGPFSIEKGISLCNGENYFDFELSIPESSVERWYPIGYGQQILYELEVKLFNVIGSQMSSSSRRIGFRTIKLTQDSAKDEGSLFYFVVNDIPIFCKGSNLIPLDPFEGKVTKKKIEKLVDDVIDSNMNMVRIWGGGVYQVIKFVISARLFL